MRSILAKDLRTNWLFWAAALAGHGLFVVLLVMQAHAIEAGQDQLMLPGLAELLASTIAVVSLVQSDGPSTALSDWRVRPIGRLQVLTAKISAVLAVVVLPRLIIGTLAAPMFQMSPAEAAAATGLRIGIDLTLLSLAFALAAATRSAGQAAAVGGLGLVAWLVASLVMERFRHDVQVPPLSLAVFAAICCAGIAALYLNYRLQAVRWALGVLGFAWPFAVVLAMVAGIGTAPSHGLSVETAQSLQISATPMGFSPTYAYSKKKMMHFEYKWAMPADFRIYQKDIYAIPKSGTRSLQTLGDSLYGVRDSENGTLGSVDFNAEVLPSRPGDELTIENWFIAYQRAGRISLPPSDGALHRLNGIGSCKLVDRGRSDSKQLDCLSAAFPPCLSARKTTSVCGPSDWTQWVRWPSPFAVTELVHVEEPDISVWSEKGRYVRRVTLSKDQVAALMLPRPLAITDDEGL